MVNERGGQGERKNALWGTGNRGGESRSNALWGKGGRGALLSVVAAFALVVPLGASAGKSTPSDNKPGKNSTWIAPALTDYASKNPNKTVSVIIQSTGGVSGAKKTRGCGSKTMAPARVLRSFARACARPSTA